MTQLLVIQHAETEGLGTLSREIEKAGMTTETLEAFREPQFPSGTTLEGYGALIILGGPQSATDEGKYPWMRKEMMVIREALRQKKPILGICLGAQLLAKASGARVFKGSKKEIGWGWIRFDDWFSKRNPLTFQLDLARPHTVFHWHGDTFDFPVEGYRLAWNENYPAQMFGYQGNAIGIQFHPEMTADMVTEWLRQGKEELKRAGVDETRIIKETPRYLPELEKLCHKFFYGFASLIRENVRRAA